MKNLELKFSKRMRFIAGGILGIIALMILLINPILGTGLILAIAPLALTDQEQALVDHIKGQMQAEVEKVQKGYISETKANENINLKLKEFETKIDEEKLKSIVSEFNQKLKAQWEAVETKLKAQIEDKPQTFGDKLKKAFVDAGLIEQVVVEGVTVERVKWNRDLGHRVEIKAVDMNTANTIAGVSTGYQSNYGMIKQELPLSSDDHMYDVFGHTPLGEKDYFSVVVEGTESDGAAIKAETAVAGDSSFLMSTLDYKKFDYAVKFRVHENMLNNWSGLLARIQTLGLDRLKSKISTYVLGSGGNNTSVPPAATTKAASESLSALVNVSVPASALDITSVPPVFGI